MMELVSRNGLKGALAGREEKQVCSVLQFVNRYFEEVQHHDVAHGQLVDRALLA